MTMIHKSKERFMEKVDQVTESGCWIWTACISNRGYGLFWIDEKLRLAHRVSYEMFNGNIPSDRMVLHKCDVTCCVNPNHLFLGDHKANMEDRNNKGRQAKKERHGMYGISRCGEKSASAKLSEKNVRFIRECSLGLSYLGRMFGVTPQAIFNIRNRITWKHI